MEQVNQSVGALDEQDLMRLFEFDSILFQRFMKVRAENINLKIVMERVVSKEMMESLINAINTNDSTECDNSCLLLSTFLRMGLMSMIWLRSTMVLEQNTPEESNSSSFKEENYKRIMRWITGSLAGSLSRECDTSLNDVEIIEFTEEDMNRWKPLVSSVLKEIFGDVEQVYERYRPVV